MDNQIFPSRRNYYDESRFIPLFPLVKRQTLSIGEFPIMVAIGLEISVVADDGRRRIGKLKNKKKGREKMG